MSQTERLSSATLTALPATVAQPGYDRAAQGAGIVHFGIGAFHRAHQAWYTDRAMANGDQDWGIIGVSLRSASVARQLNPQDGLYTLTECSAAGQTTQVIGAVQRVLVASEEPEAVIAALAAPETRIVTFTVTEKGYCRAADGSLDPFLAHHGSIYHYLELGLRRRQDAGLPGLTLLSCDNLAHNGRQLERLMAEHLERQDPGLARWVAANCTFPCAMVDRIVPATTAADRKAVYAATGLEDDGAVMTEPFSQWVIEDRFAGPRPAWEKVGAELVADVAPYETAKLRLLNGAHSALAYLGLQQGHTFVHEAVADPAIRPLIERLMRQEALPTIAAAPGQDLNAYADALLERFANPALNHRLIQIAMDGSQKIPQRWLDTLAQNRRQGRPCPAILAALAAWLGHVRGDNAAQWGPVDDPKAGALADAWQGGDARAAIARIIGKSGVVASTWEPSQSDLDFLADRLA
ncbi:fructuronate reductase [Novosphingobium sp. Rr 2-17]|uniref:mannitol dehydrogenase family protein n=1 Tax=Novosphingobium sp. Rr 2-17 TaxID=555793 RepID=UPI0002698BDC|nr:mannitol dehydrogenase family protein [Novosphingobium sp. Rr 2-17]EIZ78650.1 fructuronate reductase [Novosphingobium sp. Rr 2-17]